MQAMTTPTTTVTPPLTTTMVTTLTPMVPCVLVWLEWPRATGTAEWEWPTMHTLEVIYKTISPVHFLRKERGTHVEQHIVLCSYPIHQACIASHLLEILVIML